MTYHFLRLIQFYLFITPVNIYIHQFCQLYHLFHSLSVKNISVNILGM